MCFEDVVFVIFTDLLRDGPREAAATDAESPKGDQSAQRSW